MSFTVLEPQAPSLEEVKRAWAHCRKCPLGKTTYRRAVLDLPDGPEVDVLVIGEGPGVHEENIGSPFQGQQGQFFRKMLKDGDSRGLNIGYTNLLACRPKEYHQGPTRKPTESEVEACRPRVVDLIRALDPVVIITVGRYAYIEVQNLLLANGIGRPEVYPVPLLTYIMNNGREECPSYQTYLDGLVAAMDCARQRKGIRL